MDICCMVPIVERFIKLTNNAHDLHGGVPGADAGDPLGEGPLVDKAQLKGITPNHQHLFRLKIIFKIDIYKGI